MKKMVQVNWEPKKQVTRTKYTEVEFAGVVGDSMITKPESTQRMMTMQMTKTR
jgi:hypothetical protein